MHLYLVKEGISKLKQEWQLFTEKLLHSLLSNFGLLGFLYIRCTFYMSVYMYTHSLKLPCI